jgi:hypothetical protein
MGAHKTWRAGNDAAIRGSRTEKRNATTKSQAIKRSSEQGKDGAGHEVGLHVPVRQNGSGCGA